MDCKLGCFNRPWNKWDLERALKGISQAGFEYLGLLRQKGEFVISADSTSEEVAKVARRITDYGLKPVVTVGSVATDLPVAEAAERLRREVDNAERLGADYVLTMGCDDPNKYDHYFDVISRCTDYASERGIIITLKPHGGLSATGRECVEAVKRINSKSFRIWYDPGNVLFYAGVRPEEDIKQVAEYVVGLCVKDNKGGKGGSVQISPGDGEVDFESVFCTLRDAGFSGPCVVETLGGQSPEEIDVEAKKTYKFLTDLLARLSQDCCSEGIGDEQDRGNRGIRSARR